jgi:hypothetical protein
VTAEASGQLVKLMSRVKLLMLDFDGPICSVFAGLPATIVADQLRDVLRSHRVVITPGLEEDNDPLSIYRRSSVHGRRFRQQRGRTVRAAGPRVWQAGQVRYWEASGQRNGSVAASSTVLR